MKIPRVLRPMSGLFFAQLWLANSLSAASVDAPLPSAPLPSGIDLNQIYIKGITVNGTGCRTGNFEQNLSNDKRAFTLTFSEFFAEIGPGLDPGRARRNCNVTLKLNVPAGYQYTVGTFNYRGHMTLDAGVKGELATNYFFSGVPAQGTYSKARVGDFDEDYVFTDAVGFTTNYVPGNWSPCDVERPFSINSTITLSRLDGNSNSQGLISSESIDGELVQQFGLAYRRCGDNTPPNPTNPDPTPNPDPVTPPTPTPTETYPNNGLENGKIYNIVNRYSSQCFDVRDHATYAGAALQQWICTGEPHQKFRALYQADGTWHLVGVESGKYVSMENGWTDNGNSLVQYDFTGADSQRLYLDRSPEGYYKMKFRHSGKCVDVDGPNVSPGTRTHQWDCSSTTSQEWLFLSERPAAQDYVEYQLVSRRSGKCLDVSDHGVDNGVRLQQWTCTNEPHQRFRLVPYGGGSYSLVGAQSGRTVTVRDWANWNGAEIIQWDDQWGANQRVILTPSFDGSYQVRFNHSSKCLDLESGNSFDGGRIQQFDCQIGHSAQDWFLRR